MLSDGDFEVGTALTGSPLDTAQGVADDNWGVDFDSGKVYITAFDSVTNGYILEFDTTTLELTDVHRDGIEGVMGGFGLGFYPDQLVYLGNIEIFVQFLDIDHYFALFEQADAGHEVEPRQAHVGQAEDQCREGRQP